MAVVRAAAAADDVQGLPAGLEPRVVRAELLRVARVELGRGIELGVARARGIRAQAAQPRTAGAEPVGDDPDLAAVKGATFVDPVLVCEVEYLEITKSTKKMRAPSFKGLREDKAPEECVLERPRGR